MSTVQTKTIIDELKKQIEQKNVNEIITLLNTLSDLKITIKILKETGVGKSVGLLRKTFSSNDEIKTLASSLVNKWKQMCSKKAKKNGNNKSSSSKNSSNNTNNDKKSKSKSKLTSKMMKFDPESNKYDWRTSNHLRNSVRKGMIESLKPNTLEKEKVENIENIDIKLDDLMPINYIDIGIDVENGLYEQLYRRHDNGKAYKEQFRNISFNIKQNVLLKIHVLTGGIAPKDLATMTTEEMADESLKEKRESTKNWNLMAIRSDRHLVMAKPMTDEYKCFKCGSRKTSYRQQQTRAADEPMTTFITCLDCLNKWKD